VGGFENRPIHHVESLNAAPMRSNRSKELRQTGTKPGWKQLRLAVSMQKITALTRDKISSGDRGGSPLAGDCFLGIARKRASYNLNGSG